MQAAPFQSGLLCFYGSLYWIKLFGSPLATTKNSNYTHSSVTKARAQGKGKEYNELTTVKKM